MSIIIKNSNVCFGPKLDPDAVIFLNVANITDSTISTAINTLVVDLKSYGIWTKMKAVYPFVGGTADTHKWNLKDPRDLDEAFRLTFLGGITHSTGGIQGNGINGFADTNFIPTATDFNIDDVHYKMHSSIYVTTNIQKSPTIVDMGRLDIVSNAARREIIVASSNAASNFVPIIGNNQPEYPSTPNNDSRGYYCSNRMNNSDVEGYKNGTKVIDATQVVSSVYPLISISLCGSKTPTSYNRPSDRTYALATIGEGLTVSENLSLYQIVQEFQTTLGRNV